ncbi:hypothetical protein [Ornithinibacillus sp. FSL M8-0202]|uniref:hypothetical protein n=1 Tax=Ornithinibacillus sp. FSL M8-0202 TaxID=2921616 RepID=UPI0030D212B8
MNKTKLISILLFVFLVTLITLLVMIKNNNNNLQEMYIKNSISEPLTQFASNIKTINIQLEDVISTREISLNELEKLETTVIQTSQYLNDFQNNYNEFIEDEEELILDATIPESRLIQVQNNLHAIHEKLVDTDYDQNKIHEFNQEELELLESNQVITSYYDKVIEILENTYINESIKNKRDFKGSKPWLDFIKKLDSDIGS